MKALFIFTTFLIFVCGCSSLTNTGYTLPEHFKGNESDSSIRIAFYNLENLFDTLNDPLKDDDAFTPNGANRWVYSRYRAKVFEHAQTIRSLGGWDPPAIFAFCEIENEDVVQALIDAPPLRDFDYKIIHFESPDPRGIDVGLIYRSEELEADTTCPVLLGVDSLDRPLRDFLWTRWEWKGQFFHTLFVHWPSRYGGQKSSEEKRFQAASRVNDWKDQMEKIYINEPWILMGDFNDEPSSTSIVQYLGTEGTHPNWLNLFGMPNDWPGTHVHNGVWNYLDQCFLSREFLKEEVFFGVTEVNIFNAQWLLEKNDQGQVYPFRTYLGPAYHGGPSDHLPIYIDLYFRH